MDFWRLFQEHKWGNAGWMILFVLSIVLLINLIKQKRLKSWLLFLPLFAGIIVYNPVFAELTVGRVFPGYLEYERLTWVMCIPILIAAVFSESLGKFSITKANRVIVVTIVLLIMISQVADPIMKLGIVPENMYKVSDSVLEIADDLIQDVESEGYDTDLEDTSRSDKVNRPTVLVQTDSDAGKDGDSMYYGIRQYSSKVRLEQTIIKPEVYNADDFNIADWALERYQYFVCKNNENLKMQAESLGFELVSETDEYVLLKNMKVLTIYFVTNGQTEIDDEDDFVGAGTNVALSEEGEKQSIAVGEALADVDFTSSYSSELTRAMRTTDLILSENTKTDDDLKNQTLHYLNDMYYGEIDGMSLAEVMSMYPDYSDASYLGEINDSTFVSPVGAESRHNVLNRFHYVIYDQILAYSSTGENVLVVGHKSLQWWLQTVLGDYDMEALDDASITVLKYDRGSWNIQCLNTSAEEYEVADE